MPRNKKCRWVKSAPETAYFKPRGTPMSELSEMVLTVEGLEAIRLADVERMDHEGAAAAMGISRPTFSRILSAARHDVGKALVNGWAIRIGGGDFSVRPALPEKGATDTQTGQQGEISMKLAVSSEGPTLDSKVDPRFGRAAGFIIVDVDTMEFSHVDNGDIQVQPRGAGIQTTQRIAGQGVSVVLTGVVGPKAFEALNAAGIKVGTDLEGLTVKEAVERFKAGKISFAQNYNR